MYHGIPPALTEITNGALMIVFMGVVLTNVFYLGRRWFLSVSAIEFYREEKSAIALSWIFFGVMARSGVLWYWRMLRNDGAPIPLWFEYSASWILLASTVVTIVGGLCWMRVIFEYRGGVWTWMTFGLASIAFGMLFAM